MTALPALALLLALTGQPPTTPTPAAERVVGIRVHGNHTTPDAEVLRLAAVGPDHPFTEDLLEQMRKRLDDSGRFRSVEVRKRYASISDLSAVLIVIVVEEEAGISLDVPSPGPFRKLKAQTMWLPIFRSEDGYGLTYGARFSFVDIMGRRTRLSVPLSWGGERRATVDLERRFERGPFTRLLGGGGITRREHPTLDVGDTRAGGRVRAERGVGSWLRLGGGASLDDVRFGDLNDRLTTLGGDVVVDTRRDPAFPRNAIYGSVALERLWFDSTDDTVRLTADARGFVGLFGQTVLALRAQHIRAADPLPPFEQSLLGGDYTLRGFKLGYRTGDRLLAGSAEIRVPLSTPRHVTRLGLAVFADTGTVYTAHEALESSLWDTGVGAGVFVQAPLIGLRLDVARGLGSGTRVHFTLGATF
jgi:outer membrane protein assembly factor BamA